MPVTLKPREYRFPLRRLWGASRQTHPACKAFLMPQRDHKPDRRGESIQGRARAKQIRRVLREHLGRRPTAREYRAAKRALRKEATDG